MHAADIVYRPGSEISATNALSHSLIPGKIPGMDIVVHEVTNVSQSRLDQDHAATERDSTLTLLKEILLNGWPSLCDKCPP